MFVFSTCVFGDQENSVAYAPSAADTQRNTVSIQIQLDLCQWRGIIRKEHARESGSGSRSKVRYAFASWIFGHRKTKKSLKEVGFQRASPVKERFLNELTLERSL